MENKDNIYISDEDTQARLGQVWTPTHIVEDMMNKIDNSVWDDPNKTFLDPTMGSGNIVLNMLKNRIERHDIDPLQALKTCYGVEVDNSTLIFAKERIKEYMAQFTKDDLTDIIDFNFVAHDILTWCFWGEDFGCGCDLCNQLGKKRKIERWF